MKYRIAKLSLATSLLASPLLATLLVSSSPAVGQESQALSLETHIALTNVKGRVGHSSVDVKGRRLFVAAVDNHTLEVIDREVRPARAHDYRSGRAAGSLL
jgi:hypothetical protein